MQLTELSPELADAADVLSDQLRNHLLRMAGIVEPHADAVDASFVRTLARKNLNLKVRSALLAIMPGAAARMLASGVTTSGFIEEVEYHGRRLAKLNVPPSQIIQALQDYDRLLCPLLESLEASEFANMQWVREQLQFCTILTLNNAYYQVREAETQAFYELFRVELESRNLDELLRRFLQTLMRVCRAEAAHLYLWGEGGPSRALLYAGSDSQGAVMAASHTSVSGRIARRLAHSKQIDPQGKDSDLILDSDWRSKSRWCWSVPLAVGDRMSGVMQFGFAKPYEWLPREQDLLLGAAERCLLAAEKARLVENLAAREE
ncbi:MAG: GAF domain-containing protein, partial [Acidobacteriaceae bacterium]|nr:GAF domain-containing protein [Acidobacteriaceae bacterium]